MTKSLNLDFGDYLTPIVVNDTVNIDGRTYYQQNNPCEVVITNTSDVPLLLGDQYCYDNGTGVQILPGAGIAISLGASDILFGYSYGNITLPVMILDGKRR